MEMVVRAHDINHMYGLCCWMHNVTLLELTPSYMRHFLVSQHFPQLPWPYANQVATLLRNTKGFNKIE